MNGKIVKGYIRICSLYGLNPKKVYPGDFDILKHISDFEMFGIEAPEEKENRYLELLERAATK